MKTEGREENVLPDIDNDDNDDNNKSSGLFLAVKFEKLLIAPASSVQSCKSTKNKPSVDLEEQCLHSIKKPRKGKRKNKALLKKSKLGESLKKIEEENLTKDSQDSLKVFGRKFSNSLGNFSSLSLSDENYENSDQTSDKFSGESFKTINGNGCKRKRAITPSREMGDEQPVAISCGQQARRIYTDVTADELAGYLEDTTFFPKRMSYMAEMMYT